MWVPVLVCICLNVCLGCKFVCLWTPSSVHHKTAPCPHFLTSWQSLGNFLFCELRWWEKVETKVGTLEWYSHYDPERAHVALLFCQSYRSNGTASFVACSRTSTSLGARGLEPKRNTNESGGRRLWYVPGAWETLEENGLWLGKRSSVPEAWWIVNKLAWCLFHKE